MSHYFINDEHLKSDEFKFQYYYNNLKLTFISDRGVFSKNRVDFGTNLLIKSIDNLENKQVLDLGCGIGVIGITLAVINSNANFHLVDINRRALLLAEKNSQLNNAKNIQIYESNLYEGINTNFDVIISNPPIRAGKKIVHQIIDEGYKRLRNDGSIYIVIQKKQGAPSLRQKMEEVFGNIEVINKKNGYYVFYSKKGTY